MTTFKVCWAKVGGRNPPPAVVHWRSGERPELTQPGHCDRSHRRQQCTNEQSFAVAIQAIPAITTFSTEFVREPSLYRCGYILSGKRMINPSRFGIRTFGSVLASIASFSPISLFDAKM